MLFPDYKSSNGHTVIVFGRLLFHVTSASRKAMKHTVDFEGFEHHKTICDCEAWTYGERPCRHIAAVFEAISVWAKVPELWRDDFIERLMFLIGMGHSFPESINLIWNAFRAKQQDQRNNLDKPVPATQGVAGPRSGIVGEVKKRVYHLAPRKGAGRTDQRKNADTRKPTQKTSR